MEIDPKERERKRYARTCRVLLKQKHPTTSILWIVQAPLLEGPGEFSFSACEIAFYDLISSGKKTVHMFCFDGPLKVTFLKQFPTTASGLKENWISRCFDCQDEVCTGGTTIYLNVRWVPQLSPCYACSLQLHHFQEEPSNFKRSQRSNQVTGVLPSYWNWTSKGPIDI